MHGYNQYQSNVNYLTSTKWAQIPATLTSIVESEELNQMLKPTKPSKDERIDGLLSRLSESSSEKILSDPRKIELFSSDSFLALAELLDGKNLSKLVNTASALTEIEGPDDRYQDALKGFSVQSFIDKLNQLDSTTRNQVIEYANELASSIVVSKPDEVYDKLGNYSAGTALLTGENLRNFALAISRHEEPEALLEKLAPFSLEQQHQLLKVMVTGISQGEQLAGSLLEHNDQTRNAILGTLAEISNSRTAKSDRFIHEQQAQTSYVTIDYDNFSADVVDGMLKQVTDLLSSYHFSSEQLRTMGEELEDLGRTSQRAYLDITERGLEQLVHKDSMSTELNIHSDEMAVISNLRSDVEIRQLVTLSRFGNMDLNESGTFEKTITNPDVIARNKFIPLTNTEIEQRNSIDMLVLDAYTTFRNEGADAQKEKSNALAKSLNLLSADDRSSLISDTEQHSRTTRVLSEFDSSELATSFIDFNHRVNTFRQLEDISDLAALTKQIDNTTFGSTIKQKEQLYQVTNSAGTQADSVVAAMTNKDHEVRASALEYYTTVANEALDPRPGAGNPDPAEFAGQRMSLFTLTMNQQGDTKVMLDFIHNLQQQSPDIQLAVLRHIPNLS